jgi:hypothetical protein
MSDTQAAIRAAREVQADTLSPEFFRQANEWFLKARSEYKFKNFSLAKEHAAKARRFAEQAEFEAIRIGGTRTDIPPDPAGAGGLPPPPPPPEDPYPVPTGTPVEEYEKRKQAEDKLPPPPPLPDATLTTTPYNTTPPPVLPTTNPTR